MSVYTSNKSAASVTAPQTEDVNERGPLRSRLLAGDSYLHKVALGQRTIEYDREHNWRYDSFRKIQIALKIVLPELISNSNDPRIKELSDWKVTDQFDADSEGWLYTFQVLTELRENSLENRIKNVNIDAATLRRLDAKLCKIRYYSTEPDHEKTLHNASTAVKAGYLTRVRVDEAQVYKEPDPAASPFHRLEFNNRVLVVHLLRNDWCFVNLDDGTEGYAQTSKLANRVRVTRAMFDELDDPNDPDIILPDPMPDPEACLYKIKPNETLEHIIDREYDVTIELDRRFYANVLLFVNNPDRKKEMLVYDVDINSGRRFPNSDDATIYLKDGDATWSDTHLREYIAERSRTVAQTALKWAEVESAMNERYGGWNYEQIECKAYTIWLPSKKYAKSLKTVVDKGSIIRGQVADLKQAAIALRKKEIDPLAAELGQKIDLYWPEGIGIRLEGAVGATIGVPIDLDYGASFYLWRDGETIKLSRTGVIGIRPSLEVGVAVNFGTDKGRTQAKAGQAVFGFEAGAGVYAEFKLVIAQELTFPIYDDASMASFFSLIMLEPLSITGGPTAMVAAVLRQTLTFFDIDPNDYTTKFKIQGAIKGGGSAQIGAGLRFAESDNSQLGKTDDLDMYNKGTDTLTKSLSKWLSVQLSAAMANEIAMGVEYEVKDGKFTVDPNTGARVPAEFEYTVALGQNLTATASVPFLKALLPSNFAGGLKLKMGYQYDRDIQEVVENPKTYLIGFLMGVGNLDAYIEPGYEVTAWYDPLTLYLNPPDLGTLLSADADALIDEAKKLLDMFHSVEVKLRTGLGGIVGSKLSDLKNNNLQVMLRNHGRLHKGLIYTMFLDLEFKFVRADLSNFVDSFMGAMLKEMADNALKPSKALAKVLENMTVGKPPTKNAAFGHQFHKVLKEQKASLHVEAGLGIGGSIRGSAGAKGRGRFYIAVRGIGHLAVTFDQIKKLLGLPKRIDIKEKLLSTPPKSFSHVISD
jgi:hypothetical protein